MPNSHEVLISNMHFILSCIDSERDLPELDQDLMFALDACVQKGYISGVKTATMISGRIVADISTPRLTVSGLEHLYLKQDSEEKAHPEKGKKREYLNPKIKTFFEIVGGVAAIVAIISFLLPFLG